MLSSQYEIGRGQKSEIFQRNLFQTTFKTANTIEFRKILRESSLAVTNNIKQNSSA